MPVLAKGKTITGCIWASLRDDRPFGGADPLAVVFYYTRDRTKEHPRDQLSGYAGILQADAYAGYDDLYKPGRAPRPLTQTSCWAHARRDFYKQAKTDKTPLALEAVRRMDAIFTAERTIDGQSAQDRLAYRQVYIAPLVNDLETWLRAQYGMLSRKGDRTKAINYMLCRGDSFSCFLDDGRICLTNNAAERLIRTVAIGRKNWMFAGSDRGGERAAIMYSLIQTCRLNNADPHAWLADVIARISDHPQSRLTMAAISTIYTLRHVAKKIGEDEGFVWETAINKEPWDGCIHIHDDQLSDDNDWPLKTGFANNGTDYLVELIADIHSYEANTKSAPKA